MSQPDDQQRTSTQRFGLGWPAIAALIAYAVAVLFSKDIASADAQELGTRMGAGAFFGLIVCAIVGLPAFYLARRSRRVATWSCAIILLLMASAALLCRPRSPSDAKGQQII